MDPEHQFRAHLRDEGAHPLLAASVVLLVAFVGINVLPAIDAGPTRGLTVSPSPEPTRSPTVKPGTTLQPSPPGGELSPGKHLAASTDVAFSFDVATAGWSSRTEFGAFHLSRSGTGPNLAFHNPTSVFADPCAGRHAPPVGPSAADLAAAVASIPGTHATKPWDVTVGGLPAKHVTLVVREDVACPEGRFFLWQDRGPARNSKGGHTIGVWIVDVAGTRFFIESETPKGSSLWDQQEIQQIVDSIAFDLAGRPSVPPPVEAMVFPPAGALAPGWYTANVEVDPRSRFAMDHGYQFGFKLPASGWISSGSDRDGHGGYISKGTVPSPDGAVIRFSNPDRVYADPCRQTLGPPVGPSTEDLAAALASIPGTDASRPTEVELGFYWYTTAQHVEVTVRDSIPCDPGEKGFYLWHNEGEGAFSGPRRATVGGSTINAWIFKQENRSDFPRILIEAETYQGVSAELEREIWQIVDSIWYYGG